MRGISFRVICNISPETPASRSLQFLVLVTLRVFSVPAIFAVQPTCNWGDWIKISSGAVKFCTFLLSGSIACVLWQRREMIRPVARAVSSEFNSPFIHPRLRLREPRSSAMPTECIRGAVKCACYTRINRNELFSSNYRFILETSAVTWRKGIINFRLLFLCKGLHGKDPIMDAHQEDHYVSRFSYPIY